MMICRGGIVVGGWGDVAQPREVLRPRPHPIDSLPGSRERTQWASIAWATLVLFVLFALLPSRRLIPPLIESDYCYLLLAADRYLAGLGLTSLQPVAPYQPWELNYEWGFLTQWPAGFSLLIAGIRSVLGCTSIEACCVLSVAGCAAGLAGWFAFIRRCVPSGVTGFLLATVAASSAFTTSFLINPSTDLILIAAMPFVLMLVLDACSFEQRSRSAVKHLAAAGALSGMIVWFRYAAIFVPVGVGVFLAYEWVRKRLSTASIIAFALPAAGWIATLFAVNSQFSPAENLTRRFNLGESWGLDFSFSMLAQAWWTFTDFGYYAHRPAAHWIIAMAPLALLPFLSSRKFRDALIANLSTPSQRLAACTMVTLLGMVLATTVLFRSKYDYIVLERYYLPVRPLYVLGLLSPLMLIPRRAVRATMCVMLTLLASWTVFHDWSPTLNRWATANRAVTPAGAWSMVFEPDAKPLYQWLARLGDDPSLLIISNFHEFVAFETGIVTVPIPKSPDELDRVLRSAQSIRGVPKVTPVFVLHPGNLWRSHWLPDLELLKRDLRLEPVAGAPPELRQYLFIATNDQRAGDISFTSISWN